MAEDGRDGSQVEHERTYVVEDDLDAHLGALPDPVASLAGADGLRASAPQRVRLTARYLDTEDLALLRQGITLRRREGGADEGWHLKLPLGGDRRLELRRPLGADVPDELLDEVRAVVRDRPLDVVATVTTDRTETALTDADGREVGVLSDDRVSAGSVREQVARTWREWEVELAPTGTVADLDAVERLVVAAGARPSPRPSKLGQALGRDLGAPTGARAGRRGGRRGGRRAPGRPRTAGEVLRLRLAEQVGELHRADADLRTGRDGGVHRMRVAARRLRSALQTCAPLLREGSPDHLRAELRLLGRVLGPVRDAEVLEHRLLAAVRDEPGELVLGPVVARITADLHRDRDRARARAVQALSSERYWRLLDDLDAVVADPPLRGRAGGRAAPVLAGLVRRDAKRLRRRAAAVPPFAGAAQDEALHEVRKHAKRLRYAAELVQPVGGRRARRLRARAAAVQKALGEHQDAVVAGAALRRLGVSAHLAGENGFSFGLLLGSERARAEAARDDGVRALRRVPGPKDAARWVR